MHRREPGNYLWLGIAAMALALAVGSLGGYAFAGGLNGRTASINRPYVDKAQTTKPSLKGNVKVPQATITPTETPTDTETPVPCADIYEPDNNAAQSRTFTVGSTQSHAFCVPGDEDWVDFTATDGLVYHIETLNLAATTDTYIELYDTNGVTLLAFNDDSGSEPRASLISYQFSGSGSYYVKARQYEQTQGDPDRTYDLRITQFTPTPTGTVTRTPTATNTETPLLCTDAYEPDNTPAQASIFTVGSTQQNHAFCVPGDQDWVRFTATAGITYTIETRNLAATTDTYIELYDTNGTALLAADDDSGGEPGASLISYQFSVAGTYYVKVRQFESTQGDPSRTYALRITEFTPTPTGTVTRTPTATNTETPVLCTDIYEPDNTPAQASAFTVGSTQQNHAFCVPGDQDWVRFTATIGPVYHIETLNLAATTDTYIELYDTNGTALLASDDDSGGEPGASLISYQFSTSGTYYVKARQFESTQGDPSRTYALRITEFTPTPTGTVTRTPTATNTETPVLCTDAYEPDNTPAQASAFTVGSTQQNHAFCVPGDQDWVRFVATAGITYTIETRNLAATTDTYIELYDTNGTTLLAFDDDSGGEPRASLISYQSSASGTYYVKARQFEQTQGDPDRTYDLRITQPGFTATPTASPTRTAIVTPTNTAIAGPALVGHVNWQGRPTQPDNRQRLPITLTLKLGTTTEVNYPSQLTDVSGSFSVSVGSLANGTYRWRVKGPKFVANSGQVVLTGAPTTQLEMGLMKVGDSNNDNIINASDFNILRGMFGRGSGDPGYDDRADLNGDLTVNGSDFNLLRVNFGVSGAPPLNPGPG